MSWLGFPAKTEREKMQIEIWDREAIDGDRAVLVTMSSVNGIVTQHANYETAFEYLHGLVKELKAAVDTAEVMYLRKPNAESEVSE